MLRDRFPIFAHKTFLNSCSKGALSLEVREAYGRYLDDWQGEGSPWELWVETLEKTRESFARLIGASPQEVAVTTSVSAALSALASALSFEERPKVIVSDAEFPTVAQIWHAQERRGARVVHLPEEGGGVVPLETLEGLIDDETALVSLAHVCYRNGAKQDAGAAAELAHRRGALLVLDAYQSLGTMPLNVKELDVDVMVGGALKYLLGSSGLAFMYVREGLKLEPTATGWFAQDDIMALDIYAHTPSPTARRFESGTPSVPNLYAGLAGLELVRSVGLERIERQLEALTGAIKDGARERGLALATPAEHGALIAFKARDARALVGRLAAAGIVVSERDGNLRVSPHFYNDYEDVERLFACLDEYREGLEASR